MKLNDFKALLKNEVTEICVGQRWNFDNNKQRGMAFEDWCFNLLSERFESDENDKQTSLLRTDDFGVDVVFESRENREVHILQCKFEKIAANDPIDEESLAKFFNVASHLRDEQFIKSPGSKNERISTLSTEYIYWIKNNFAVHFTFVSTGRRSIKTDALVEKYTSDFKDEPISFHVWDVEALKEEYISVKSVEQHYPETVNFTVGEGHFLSMSGDPQNITFAVRGTVLKSIYHQHKDRLFNWNIRRFLGRKGQVNEGIRTTLADEPELFFLLQ